MKIKLYLAATAAVALLASCGGNAEREASRKQQDSIDNAKNEARKNAPAKPVTWAELQGMDDKTIDDARINNMPVKVEITGFLAVPSQIYSSKGSIRCNLFQRPNQVKGYHVNLEFATGKTANHMENLGTKFSTEDFKVHTHSNEVVGEGAFVKITGEVYHNEADKATIYVTKVEKAEGAGEPDFSSAVEYKAADEDKLKGKMVYVTGSLEMGIMANVISGNCYMLHMSDVKEKDGTSLGINIPIGTTNNRMADLPNNYSNADIKILDDKGNRVPMGKKVKVYGVYDDIGGIYLEKIEAK